MIVNDEQRRALEFIATANRGGWRPAGREINEWRLRPDPKPARQGKLLESEVPAVPEQRVRTGRPTAFENTMQNVNLLSDTVRKRLAELNMSQLSGLNLSVIQAMKPTATASLLMMGEYLGEYKTIPGKPGRPAVYAPDRPTEKFLAHLRRLGWIERDHRGRYGVTRLGHAPLRAEASVDSEGEASSVMVLEADDELAYGQVLGVIAECGDALIVDAYLGAAQLRHILEHTNACRFIVGSKLGKARVAELSIMIELTPLYSDGPARELRQADFHDRWLIGDQEVYGLGSSLNGVGKATTTLVQMPEITARGIRSNAEDLWLEAEVIAQTRQDDDAGEEGDKGDETSDVLPIDAAVREVDGAFVHGTCTVRHRSMTSAERCTKGA